MEEGYNNAPDKKTNLSLNFKNYRPRSNFSFISKLAEKVALKQINPFLNNTNLYLKHNSGYKSHHSTETLLMKINDDIIKAIDNQKITLLILLGLSAAFDTVYFKKLSDTLIKRFNFIGSGLNWFKSYLKDRTF